jgi:hypothetical protein
MRIVTITSSVWLLGAFCVTAAELPEIDYPSVGAVLEALRADRSAKLDRQAGWIVVSTIERGNPVLWSFTPEGHPAHPSVVKRTALEQKGTGYVELATLCEAPEPDCARLLEDFKQVNQRIAQSALAKRVELDVDIAWSEHSRVRVNRMVAEEGKAAEVRVDGVAKVVIVPSWDELRGVMLWAAFYEFDGGDFRLLSAPTLAAPGNGTAEVDFRASSGESFRFSVTPLAAAREAGPTL